MSASLLAGSFSLDLNLWCEGRIGVHQLPAVDGVTNLW